MANSYVEKISTNDFQDDEYILDVSKADTIYIQQNGGFTYSVSGDLCGENIWTNLPSINLENYNFDYQVGSKGTHLIDVSNFKFIKLYISNVQSESFLFIKVVGDLW